VDVPSDPWATARLDESGPNGAGPTRPIPSGGARFGPVPPELRPPGSSAAAFAGPDADDRDPVDPWLQPHADPWIDVTPRTDASARGATPTGGRRLAAAVGLVVAGAVAGALLVGVYNGWGSEALNAGLAQQNGTAPNGQAGQGPQGHVGPQGQGGQGLGAPGFGGSGGEQHLYATLTAVSNAKLGVKTSTGTATYTIASDTQIVRDGRLASASDLRVGDAVLVHVFTAANSDGVLERVIARSGSTSNNSSGDSSSTEDSATT
jgi:hypothetical protein